MRSDIADFDRHAERQFTLHVEGVLLDARRSRVRVDDAEALSDAGEVAQRVAGRAARARRGTDWSGCWPASRCRRWRRRRWWSRCSPADCKACRWRTAAPRTGRSRRGSSSWTFTCQAKPKRGPILFIFGLLTCMLLPFTPANWITPFGRIPVTFAASGFTRLGIEADDHGVVLFLQAVLTLPAQAEVDGEVLVMRMSSWK